MGVKAAQGGKRRRQRSAPMADINVTPFIDVMLVLLLVFMVAAPLVTAGIPLKLPQASSKPLAMEQQEPLTVNINDQGQVFLQTSEIALESLPEKLQAIMAERKSDKVFLRADGNVDYGMVMRVMGYLNAGGFKNIGLVTDARGASEPKTAKKP